MWLMALVVLIPAVIGTGYWIYWDRYVRYAPVTITSAEDAPRIQALLDRSDYLTPGGKDRWVYLVTHRSCKTCNDYQDKEFPSFQNANVETRVAVFALADNGATVRSSPQERSTIAELWLTRNWNFYQAWRLSTDDTWTAEGLPVADNSLARSAVVGASRSFNDELGNLLRRNKVTVSYPLLIWRDRNNQLRVCACSNEKAWKFVRDELGAKDAPSQIFGVEVPSDILSSFGTSSSSAAGPPTRAAEQP